MPEANSNADFCNLTPSKKGIPNPVERGRMLRFKRLLGFVDFAVPIFRVWDPVTQTPQYSETGGSRPIVLQCEDASTSSS